MKFYHPDGELFRDVFETKEAELAARTRADQEERRAIRQQIRAEQAEAAAAEERLHAEEALRRAEEERKRSARAEAAAEGERRRANQEARARGDAEAEMAHMQAELARVRERLRRAGLNDTD